MGARRLTLLRHGRAQAPDACAEDFERVLTRRGQIEAQEMAARLVRRDLIPDLVLVSPAERAWATAEILAATCELEARQVQCARELYLATAEGLWRVLGDRAEARSHILICGHNPGLSDLASRFGPKPQRRDLATGGLATATWHDAEWRSLQPETAQTCQMDEPDNITDLWT
jgi:phosphohistidine phosphatase